MRRLEFAVFLLILSSSTTYAAKDEYDNIHTVAVVTTIGDTFTYARVGPTVFGVNDQKTMPITDWGIDQAITDQIQTLLAPRFAFKSIDVKAMNAALNPGTYLRSLPPDSGIDAYILVTEGSLQLAGTPWLIRGLGLYDQDGMFTDIFGYYAAYEITVFDAKTFKRIDGGRSRTDNGGFLSYWPPLAPADKSDWTGAPELVTDHQRQDSKVAIEALVQQTIPHALRDSGLLDAPNK
jgi:hypothetical protein